jgi:hypothetical protein
VRGWQHHGFELLMRWCADPACACVRSWNNDNWRLLQHIKRIDCSVSDFGDNANEFAGWNRAAWNYERFKSELGSAGGCAGGSRGICGGNGKMNWGTILLLIGGGILAAIVIPNIPRCAGGVAPTANGGWYCANGNWVSTGGTCAPATAAQMFNCYTSLSGGAVL